MLRKNTTTLAMSRAIVTTGRCRVPMLSFSGNTGGAEVARRAPRSGRRREWSDAGLALRDVLVGVVARPHERPGGDVLEPEPVGRALERGELVGVPVAHDRKVLLRGPQVLAHREHLDAVLAQDPERLDELVVRLAETDHEARLRRDAIAAHVLGVA